PHDWRGPPIWEPVGACNRKEKRVLIRKTTKIVRQLMSQDEVTTLIDLKQSAILPSSAMPIRRKSIHRCLGQIFACCLILVLPAAGQDAVSQIKAEANRLQQSFKDKPFSVPELPNASAVLEGAVKSVKEAADAGRVYRSLE